MGIRAVVALSVVLTAVAAGACGSAGAPDPADAAAPRTDAAATEVVGLSAVAVYGRHAAVRGKVDVRVTNEGDREVSLVSYQVRHPLYEEVPPTERESRVAPGATVLRPVDFGEPRCDVSDPTGAVVVVEVKEADRVTPVALPLPDEGPGLARAHEIACAAQAVADVAAPAFGERWTAAGDAVESTFSVRRPDGRSEAVSVTAVAGSILFSVEPARPWPLTLSGDDTVAEVPVLLTVARCDPHALIESKTSFTFPVSVQVGDAEAVPVKVTVGPDGREALQGLLDRVCGLSSDPS